MPLFRSFLLGLAVCVGSMVLAYAADPAFDVKTGLWEVTSTGSMSGAPPIPQDALARMTPEQRAQMEAAMQTVVNRTASLIETRVECTGQQRKSGTFRFQAVSREAIRGDMSMVMSSGDKTMNSKYTLQGKWLGADCGNVKPSGE